MTKNKNLDKSQIWTMLIILLPFPFPKMGSSSILKIIGGVIEYNGLLFPSIALARFVPKKLDCPTMILFIIPDQA